MQIVIANQNGLVSLKQLGCRMPDAGIRVMGIGGGRTM